MGAVRTDCVLVPKENIHNMPANVVACQLWRWPTLSQAKELKQSPSCRSKVDPIYICCNPAHWSRRVEEIGMFVNLIKIKENCVSSMYLLKLKLNQLYYFLSILQL